MMKQQIKILRRCDVEGMIGYKRSTIYDWIDPASPRYKPDFPKPISFRGCTSVRWLESEVQGWLEEQVRVSRSTSGRIDRDQSDSGRMEAA